MAYLDDERRNRSDELTFQAERFERAGDFGAARLLYAEAAELETAVALEVPPENLRIRSVLAESAASLWYRARQWDQVERVASRFLSDAAALVPESAQELRSILADAWSQKELEAFQTSQSGVALEARLEGGEVGFGSAPSQAVAPFRNQLDRALLRAAEWNARDPFRKTGRSRMAGKFVLRELPAKAGSFALRFVLVAPGEQMIETGRQAPLEVVTAFFSLAQAAAESPERLRELVPEPEYAEVFTRLFKELAPRGEQVGGVSFSSPVWPRPVHLAARTHAELARRLRTVDAHGTSEADLSVQGVLRNIKLQGDTPAIGIETEEGFESLLIKKGVHDDMIGTLLNRTVRVTGRRIVSGSGERQKWADYVEGAES